MLSLKQIIKDYQAGDTTVQALKGVSVNFRENEFVSILGPSGCGKTTLLNIIGGLDKYTSGDLFINGVSTKKFDDKAWDVYRNHRIGFIFQSYNLIPHQTVLQNVELALTIAGISKSERINRAKTALDTVGLAGQYNKRPNQLSGGQCQRVAIARALVNEPEILLADEPTGALDTETSEQIMELIKKIAETRLVIMVTHNPDLAERYSTRIIRLLDGEIVDDSNPFSEEDEEKEMAEINARLAEKAAAEQAEQLSADGKKRKKTKKERAKMSLWTALKLSATNLSSKKKRTALTSFAGSIGIIGISMVLSISYGIQAFINSMQSDMLSGNPISITQSAYDLNALMGQTTTLKKAQAAVNAGFVNVDSMVEFLVERAEQISNITVENTIKPEYVSYVNKIPEQFDAMVKLDYGLDIGNNLYFDFQRDANSQTEKISLAGILAKYSSVLKTTNFGAYSSYISSLSSAFAQAPNDKDYLLSQYDLLDGHVASGKNEVMIVVNSDTELTDLLLAELGYYTEEEFLNIVYRATEPEGRYDASLDKKQFSYAELMGRTFTWYDNDTIFTKNPDTTTQEAYPYFYNETAAESWNNGVELNVVGILKPKESISYGCLSAGFYYTEEMSEYIIKTNSDTQFLKDIFNLGEEDEKSTYPSVVFNGVPMGITFDYSYDYYDDDKQWITKTATTCVGSANQMSLFAGLMGMGGGGSANESYMLSLQELGGKSIPVGIYVYPVTFSEKDRVLSYLDKWNADGDIVVDDVTYTKAEREKITYTDTLSLVIDIINSLVKVITYALIAFTALSLVVSCVMIAVTTYISIAERIKEIGIIRSLGGRKSDVSSLFNAETLMIGASSGLIGVVVTYILSAILNAIIKGLTGIATIALFPWFYALMMIAVSIILTVISGLLPARSAAKKDPVVALRTE